MLRRDPRAGFRWFEREEEVYVEQALEARLFERNKGGSRDTKTVTYYYFESGKHRSSYWTESRHQEAQAAQELSPVPIARARDLGRTWWWFKGQFYWEDEDYSRDQVKLLVLDREAQKQKRLDRAAARTARLESSRRQPIDDEIKVFVWNRDGGRCVHCGSQQNLEFDHVIPVSMGGSSTARNLQLLCEACNRAKGGNLT